MLESKDVEYLRKKMKELANFALGEHSKKYLKSPYFFYGLKVPQLRAIAKEFKKIHTEYNDYDYYNIFEELWGSGNHEEMSIALYLIEKNYNLETWKFLTRENILSKLKTWDHVDSLGTSILGNIFLLNPYLQSEIKKWAESKDSWLRRLSIVTQYPLIKKGKIQLVFLLAEKLVYDEDVYVQKGAGWMVREAGKKNPQEAKQFILIHKDMKSHALSYATEKMKELRHRIREEKKQEKENPKQKLFEEESEQNTQQNIDDKIKNPLDKIKYFKGKI